MNKHLEEYTDVPYIDRSTRLTVMGIVQLCFGAFCGLLAALSIMGVLAAGLMSPEAAEATGMKPGMMLTGVLVYVLIAAWFVTMGVGSIKARRWARALILTSSWIGLVAGTLGTFFLVFMMGDMFEQMAKGGNFPPGFAQVMKVTMFAFAAVFYIAFPGALVLAYRGRDVKGTCEYRNPASSWTDSCPLPVLAHVLIFASYTCSLLFMAGYNWTMPFFGMMLSGAAGALVSVVIGLLSAGLAWGAYKLKFAAWWGSVVFIIVWGGSALYTFTRLDLMAFYETMGMPAQQLEALRPVVESGQIANSMMIGIPIWIFGVLGLLAYTHRYYGNEAETDAATL